MTTTGSNLVFKNLGALLNAIVPNYWLLSVSLGVKYQVIGMDAVSLTTLRNLDHD